MHMCHLGPYCYLPLSPSYLCWSPSSSQTAPFCFPKVMMTPQALPEEQGGISKLSQKSSALSFSLLQCCMDTLLTPLPSMGVCHRLEVLQVARLVIPSQAAHALSTGRAVMKLWHPNTTSCSMTQPTNTVSQLRGDLWSSN